MQQLSPDQLSHLIVALIGVYLVVFIVAIVAVLVPAWFICKKAGFSPWLSLLVIVPLGGLVLLYVLAFADWKVVPVPQPAWPYPPPYPPVPPQPPQA